MWHNYWNWTMKTWFIQFFSTTLCLFLSNIKICVPRCSFWLILVVSVLNSSSYLIFNSLYEKKKSSNLEISINFGAVLYLNELTYHTQIGRIWKRKNNFFKMGPIWLWSLYSFRFYRVPNMGELCGDFLMILTKHISTLFTITWLWLNQYWQNSWSK